MALDDGRVVSNFVAQALMDQPLTVYGDGQQTRSFQYVSDLIRGEAGWCISAQSYSFAQNAHAFSSSSSEGPKIPQSDGSLCQAAPPLTVMETATKPDPSSGCLQGCGWVAPLCPTSLHSHSVAPDCACSLSQGTSTVSIVLLSPAVLSHPSRIAVGLQLTQSSKFFTLILLETACRVGGRDGWP